jgi:hypothetical protein
VTIRTHPRERSVAAYSPAEIIPQNDPKSPLRPTTTHSIRASLAAPTNRRHTPATKEETQVRKLILSVTATAAAFLVPALVIAAGATASTTTERFSFADATASNGPPVWSVIATGHFIAGGTATQKSKSVLTLHFSAGTITLKIGNNHKKLSKDQTATACIQTQTGSSTYTIAAGTGAYRGISGSGRATLHNTFVEDAANGHCSNAFAATQSLITASGPVSLP